MIGVERAAVTGLMTVLVGAGGSAVAAGTTESGAARTATHPHAAAR